MPQILTHAGEPVRHGRARVNGIRMHYVTAGQGEPLLLLHGTPKTHYYWAKLIPLLTPISPSSRRISAASATPTNHRSKRATTASRTRATWPN